jgi:putative membrane protein
MFVSSLLAATAAAYAGGVARLWSNAGSGRGVRVAQVVAFAGGCLAIAAALLSPLEELSERLLSVHMVQHELLMLIAAPLVAISGPLIAMLWLLPAPARRVTMGAVRRPAIDHARRAIMAPATVWLLHAIALWTWHLPALYQAAVEHEAIHAVQHLCFFGTAVMFWWGIAHGRYGRIGYGAAVVYVFATAVHSGVLGALLTFSPALWYPLYGPTTAAAGLSPLEDQQLAGLLMWVPAGGIFFAGGLLFFLAWLRESGRRASRLPAADFRQEELKSEYL